MFRMPDHVFQTRSVTVSGRCNPKVSNRMDFFPPFVWDYLNMRKSHFCTKYLCTEKRLIKLICCNVVI